MGLVLGLVGCLAEGQAPCEGASCLSGVVYTVSRSRDLPTTIPTTFAGRGTSTTLVAWVEVAEPDNDPGPTTGLLQLDHRGRPIATPTVVDGGYQWHAAVPGGFWVRTSELDVLALDRHGAVRRLNVELPQSTPAWVGDHAYFPLEDTLGVYDAEGHCVGAVPGDPSMPQLVSDAGLRWALSWRSAVVVGDHSMAFRTLGAEGVLSEPTVIQLAVPAYGATLATCGEGCWVVTAGPAATRLVVRARADGPPTVHQLPPVAPGLDEVHTARAASTPSHDVLVHWPRAEPGFALSWTRRGRVERVGWLESWPTVVPLDEHRFVILTTSVTPAGGDELQLRVLGD
jgi:hypothetical protein